MRARDGETDVTKKDVLVLILIAVNPIILMIGCVWMAVASQTIEGAGPRLTGPLCDVGPGSADCAATQIAAATAAGKASVPAWWPFGH